MTAFSLQKELFGWPIHMRLTPLDSGVHVLLFGGQRSHVGAVALAQDGQVAAGASYPGHREGQVAERWASVLSAAWRAPVTVACGIHYDDASQEQIQAVLQACEALLNETIQIVKESGDNDEI